MVAAKNHIVILGGGFGGAYCAQALESMIAQNRVDVTLIDRNNYFVFYPLLFEAGTGSLKPRHAVVPMRRFLKRGRFCMAEIKDIDPASKSIAYQPPHLNSPQKMHYDHLVLALGSVTKLPPVAGLKEFGFELKSLRDAVLLRDRAIQLLECANLTDDQDLKQSLLHFVVVGGNFNGVEAAGELHHFLHKAARYYERVDASNIKVTLVEIQDKILSALDRDLGNYAAEALKERGVQIELNNSIEMIQSDRVQFKERLGEVATHTVLWCAGIAQNPLLISDHFPHNDEGYLLCEKTFQVKGMPNVWGIGDCAVNLDSNDSPYPATAQHAIQEAKHLAIHLKKIIKKEKPEAMPTIKTRGTLAALGYHTGVAKVFGFKFSGFLAWFLWRTIYLIKMPGFARKIRIAIDWTLDLLFGRDYVQLGLHKHSK